MIFDEDSRASWRSSFDDHMASCARCRELVSALVKLESMAEQRSPVISPSPSSTITDRASGSMTAGLRIGRYEVVSRLGEGDMGVVYCAWDPELGRRVALKLLSGAPDRIAHARLHDRLRLEAQAMAQVTHPNVVTVYDVGTWDDRIFIAMELVPGQTLAQWLACGRRSWRDVLAMFLAAGRGLAGAHAAGIVHRDFKPTNVLVGRDGRVCVSDFGLATTIVDTAGPGPGSDGTVLGDGISEHGATATFCQGTPFFMAPEQLRGAPPDVRSDQYSFCVALHLAITGEHPCPGHSMDEILQACLEGRRRRAAHPRMPRRLWKVIRRGLAVHPDDRHPAMPALLAALTDCRSRRRGEAIAGAIIASIALAGALVARSAAPGGEVSYGGAARQDDIAVLAGAPELREAYAREWDVQHTDRCELLPAGCSIQATNLLRNADSARARDAWYSPEGLLDLQWTPDHLRVTAGERGGALAQEVPWIISPVRVYRFTVRMRAASLVAAATGSLALSTSGPAGTRRSTTRFLIGPDWTEVSATLPGDVHRDRLGVELALDPVSSIELEHAELGDAGLSDPGFEIDTPAVWRPIHFADRVRMSPVVTDAVDGVRALQVATTKVGGSVAQDTTRAPVTGTTYTFSAWLRAGSVGSSVAGSLTLWALGADETAVRTGFQVGHAWTQIEASLYVSDHGHSSLRAELYVDTPGVALQVDATSLVPAGLVDASFERGALGWYSPEGEAVASELRASDLGPRTGAGASWTARADAAKDGAWWLRLGGEQHRVSIAQDLGRPVPGIPYRFSAWVRAAPGSVAPVTGDIAIHGLGGASESGHAAFHVSTEWTLVAAALTVRDDDHRGLRVVIALDSPGAQLDIDGTRLSGAIVLPSSNVAGAP